MSAEKKKSIILGVTGGIAVYKSADLCSKLVAASYDVTVVMTESARKMITEQIFFTLSRNPVLCSLWDTPQWKPVHIELAAKADLLVVAPCTANFLGKYANGIADDALTTVAISHRKKILLAPAMNCGMWASPAVQMNCERIRSWGVDFVGPEKGRLACGDDGEGRMSEVADILSVINKMLN